MTPTPVTVWTDLRGKSALAISYRSLPHMLTSLEWMTPAQTTYKDGEPYQTHRLLIRKLQGYKPQAALTYKVGNKPGIVLSHRTKAPALLQYSGSLRDLTMSFIDEVVSNRRESCYRMALKTEALLRGLVEPGPYWPDLLHGGDRP